MQFEAGIFSAFMMPDWIISTFTGIVIGAIFFWLGSRYRSRARMAYQLHDFTIIGQPDVKLGDIKILYNDVAVPRVVVTQLAVWNTGNVVVKGQEIVESHPLTVCFGEEAIILHAQRVTATNDVNDFRIRISEHDRSCACLHFDYLNGGDGAKFQVIHTGIQGKAKVTGSIRGIAKGVEDWGDLQEWSQHKSQLANLAFSTMPIVVVVLLLNWIRGRLGVRYPFINKFADWLGNAFVGFVALLFLAGFVFLIYHSFHTRSRATPKSLTRR
jgi:hypothetical protein